MGMYYLACLSGKVQAVSFVGRLSDSQAESFVGKLSQFSSCVLCREVVRFSSISYVEVVPIPKM